MLPSGLIPKASVEEAPGTSMVVKPWSCAKPLLNMQMANSRARPRVVKRRVLVMSMVDSFPSVLSISLQLRSQDPARSSKTISYDPLEVAGLHKRDPVKRRDSLPNLRQALCWHLVANLEATPSDPRSWKRRRAAPLSHLASLAVLW